MAVDIISVCSDASNNQSGSDLAIVLSVLFSLYTIVSIGLTAHTIYVSSTIPPSASRPEPERAPSAQLYLALKNVSIYVLS